MERNEKPPIVTAALTIATQPFRTANQLLPRHQDRISCLDSFGIKVSGERIIRQRLLSCGGPKRSQPWRQIFIHPTDLQIGTRWLLSRHQDRISRLDSFGTKV